MDTLDVSITSFYGNPGIFPVLWKSFYVCFAPFRNAKHYQCNALVEIITVITVNY